MNRYCDTGRRFPRLQMHVCTESQWWMWNWPSKMNPTVAHRRRIESLLLLPLPHPCFCMKRQLKLFFQKETPPPLLFVCLSLKVKSVSHSPLLLHSSRSRCAWRALDFKGLIWGASAGCAAVLSSDLFDVRICYNASSCRPLRSLLVRWPNKLAVFEDCLSPPPTAAAERSA